MTTTTAGPQHNLWLHLKAGTVDTTPDESGCCRVCGMPPSTHSDPPVRGRVTNEQRVPELLRRQILCAQINVELARNFTHVAASERLAEIEIRTEVLNDLLAQL